MLDKIASLLRSAGDWFHYSIDYRIGTRYLGELIADNAKAEAMKVPFLRDLLLSDSIYIGSNITFDNLRPVATWLGKPGDPAKGGLPMAEYARRQEAFRQAEIAAMHDVPEFIRKAYDIYGYDHFVNDVGGSLCELDDPSVIGLLVKHSLILYIRVTEKAEEDALISRAQSSPKPLYYRPEFLADQLGQYLELHGLEYAAEVDPDDFCRWVFPRLFHSRVPRYEAIARPHGYTVTSHEVAAVRDEQDFHELLENAIGRKAEEPGE